MATGWGCQYLTKTDETEDYCKRLKHVCKPGTAGCILDGEFIFSDLEARSKPDKGRKVKNRSDNPLGR
jgi:hypothetical protein